MQGESVQSECNCRDAGTNNPGARGYGPADQPQFGGAHRRRRGVSRIGVPSCRAANISYSPGLHGRGHRDRAAAPRALLVATAGFMASCDLRDRNHGASCQTREVLLILYLALSDGPTVHGSLLRPGVRCRPVSMAIRGRRTRDAKAGTVTGNGPGREPIRWCSGRGISGQTASDSARDRYAAQGGSSAGPPGNSTRQPARLDELIATSSTGCIRHPVHISVEEATTSNPKREHLAIRFAVAVRRVLRTFRIDFAPSHRQPLSRPASATVGRSWHLDCRRRVGGRRNRGIPKNEGLRALPVLRSWEAHRHRGRRSVPSVAHRHPYQFSPSLAVPSHGCVSRWSPAPGSVDPRQRAARSGSSGTDGDAPRHRRGHLQLRRRHRKGEAAYDAFRRRCRLKNCLTTPATCSGAWPLPPQSRLIDLRLLRRRHPGELLPRTHGSVRRSGQVRSKLALV